MKVVAYRDWSRWFIDYAIEEKENRGDLDTSTRELLSPKQIADINFKLMVLDIPVKITKCFKCKTCVERNVEKPYHVSTEWY